MSTIAVTVEETPINVAVIESAPAITVNESAPTITVNESANTISLSTSTTTISLSTSTTSITVEETSSITVTVSETPLAVVKADSEWLAMVSILDINEDDILDNIDVVAWAAKREEWDGHCTEAEAVAAIKADAEWATLAVQQEGGAYSGGTSNAVLFADGSDQLATSSNFTYQAASGATIVAGASDQTAMTIKGAASQSVDLQQWTDSSDTVLGNVTKIGGIRLDSGRSSTSSAPALAFGDGDTGIYEVAANILEFSVGEYPTFRIYSGALYSMTSYGAYLRRAAASGTIPALSFVDDTDTGIGRAGADQLSLIAGGTEAGRVTSDTLLVNSVLKITERSSDPTQPSEGQSVIWLSDGTGKGDDGDICCASTAAGVTKWVILFDHSAGNAW